MNEVTNIHLGREEFSISVDAYSALQTYLQAIKKQAGKSGGEVADEVELRMAELLHERGVSGKKVILLKDIEFLKQQLGTPDDFKDDEENSEEETETSAPKRLFRDTQFCMVAGVAAGLAEYTGIPVAIIRLAFILLSFASGVGIIAYLLLWLLVPEAKTSSERLQMEGRPVTVQSLKTVVDRADVPGAARRATRVARHLLQVAMRFVTACTGASLIVLGMLTFACAIAGATYLWVRGLQIAGTTIFPVGDRQVVIVACALAAAALFSVMMAITGRAIVARRWTLPGWVLAGIIAVFITVAPIGAVLGIDVAPSVQQRYSSMDVTTRLQFAPFTDVYVKGDNVLYNMAPGFNPNPGPDQKDAYNPTMLPFVGPMYSVEIHTLGPLNTSSIKITQQGTALTIDSSKFTQRRKVCANAEPGSKFSLCPYGDATANILIFGDPQRSFNFHEPQATQDPLHPHVVLQEFYSHMDYVGP